MSCWRRLEIDALIAASGVRRSWDTACSRAAAQVVGGGQFGRLVRLVVESLRLRGGGELGGEGVEHALVVGRQLAAGQGERDAAAEVADDVGVVGSPSAARAPAPTRTLQPSARRVAATRPTRKPNVARTWPSISDSEPGRASDPASAASASASARARPAWSRLRPTRSTSTATMPAATAKTIRASRFSPSWIVNSWNGGVKYQLASSEAADDCGRSRQDAADEGDDHGQDQVEQQHAGQAERVAGVGEQQRQQGQADER